MGMKTGRIDIQRAPTTKQVQNHVRVRTRRKVWSDKRIKNTIMETIAAGREGE